MAIEVSYNGQILVNSVDLSDHAQKITIMNGQETRDITAHGNTVRTFRAGLATPSIEVVFWNDQTSASVAATLRTLVTITSTGFAVSARPKNTAQSTSNPNYSMVAVIDGDVTVMDDEVGEPTQVTVRFLPYSGGLTTTTTSS